MNRILIVEPNEGTRALLEHVVERLGHQPVIADANGPLDVDAAVIEPGDERGLPLARQLRALGRPVVFASTFPADQDALRLDPVAYFVKPFALHDLEEVLIGALRAAQPGFELRRSIRSGA